MLKMMFLCLLNYYATRINNSTLILTTAYRKWVCYKSHTLLKEPEPNSRLGVLKLFSLASWNTILLKIPT